MIRVLLYWPTPLALKAFTLDLYVLLKWSPSTVQMVSVPTYTSCGDTRRFLFRGACQQSENAVVVVFFKDAPEGSLVRIWQRAH